MSLPELPAGRPLRLLVVDDQPASRRMVAGLLAGLPGVEVVGEAADGEQALREALRLRPDAVCLDLQLPGLDGFTVLRLLMAHLPVPVLVLSSASGKADAFKALELGAIGFVSKPVPGGDPEATRRELLEQLAVVRDLRAEAAGPPGAITPRTFVEAAAPARLAVVAASTGGPQAVQRLLAALPPGLPLALAVAQHMPAPHTPSFAERLGRGTPFASAEAQEGDLLAVGRVLVAPGGRHLKVVRDRAGALRAALSRPAEGDGLRYVPSADLLFASAAEAMGGRVVAAVLTGMGNDAVRGVAEVKRAGGLVLAESEQSAAVWGMPRLAAASGQVDEVLPVEGIAERIARFARREDR